MPIPKNALITRKLRFIALSEKEKELVTEGLHHFIVHDVKVPHYQPRWAMNALTAINPRVVFYIDPSTGTEKINMRMGKTILAFLLRDQLEKSPIISDGSH